MVKEKIYQVEVTVKYTEMCLVKAKSKRQAIQIFKDGDLEDNPSIFSGKTIWNNDEIKTHMLGSSDWADYLWSGAAATELKEQNQYD